MSKMKQACISTLALAAAAGFAVALPGAATAQYDYFIGEVKPFGFGFCPRDWVPADGGLYSIAEFGAAFSIMGPLYGGNGSVTFGMPDLRGRALAHNGQGPGLSYMPVAWWGGLATGQVFAANLPPHTHALNGATTNGVNDHDPEGRTFRNFGAGSAYADGNGPFNQPMNANAVGWAGAYSQIAIENRQPFTAVNFCVALDGVYPSRN